MKVHVRRWHAIAQWQWDTGKAGDAAEEEDVCGICRVPFEGCCPSCKVPGDDCPLSESRLFHTRTRPCADPSVRLRSRARCSLGRVQPRLSYALSAQVDRDAGVEAAVPDGPQTVGCVLVHRNCPTRLAPSGG